jgi:4-methylaminobutanoate oxidase (formaldehyde-forming)
MSGYDVAIVGGGIWGLSTAFHLRNSSSARVILLERNSDFGQETTINAAGQVGQIRTSPVVSRAIAYALDLFESFPTRFGLDAGLVRCGSLFVALTAERLAYFEKQIAAGRAHGLRVDSLRPQEMLELVPGLDLAPIKGGYFVHGDGYLDSVQAARALARAAQSLGAELRRGVQVQGLLLDQGRAVGVQTNLGNIHAGCVIVTAGPWTNKIAGSARYSLPVQAIRHQRARTEPYARLSSQHPVLRLPDLSSYVRPEGGGLTFGHFESCPTSVDPETLPDTFRSIDLDPPVELLHRAQQQIAKLYPDLGRLAIRECCRAMITMAPDGAYAIGPVPEVPGLLVAAGCAALGIAGSAAVGQWLAQWALGQTPSEDLREFALDRFSPADVAPKRLAASASEAYARYYAIKP